MPETIAVIEDDGALRGQLISFLRRYDFEVFAPEHFSGVAGQILDKQPDLVLLDINLPHSDGFQVMRELRGQSSVPVIMLTSRTADMDELLSMHLGADDYVTKPFNTDILLARIQAVLKRSKPAQEAEEVRLGTLRHDAARAELRSEGDAEALPVELTRN